MKLDDPLVIDKAKTEYNARDIILAVCCFAFIGVLILGCATFESGFYSFLMNHYTQGKEFLFFDAGHTHQLLLYPVCTGLFIFFILRSTWLKTALWICAIASPGLLYLDYVNYKILTRDGLEYHSLSRKGVFNWSDVTHIETSCYMAYNGRGNPRRMHLSYVIYFPDSIGIDLFEASTPKNRIETIQFVDAILAQSGKIVSFKPIAAGDMDAVKCLKENYPKNYPAIVKLLHLEQ